MSLLPTWWAPAGGLFLYVILIGSLLINIFIVDISEITYYHISVKVKRRGGIDNEDIIDFHVVAVVGFIAALFAGPGHRS